MATRRSTASQKPSSRQSGLPLPSLRLPSPLRREVFGVMSIVIGLLSVIALLSPSGTVSGWWNGLLVDLFGWMAPLPALAFIALGIQLIRDGITQERYVRWETLTALAVLVLASTAFAQSVAGRPEMAEAYPVGGAIGLQILEPLTTALGFAGAVIVLFAMMLITIVVTFSISLGRIRSVLGGFWMLLRLAGKGVAALFGAASGAYRYIGERDGGAREGRDAAAAYAQRTRRHQRQRYQWHRSACIVPNGGHCTESGRCRRLHRNARR